MHHTKEMKLIKIISCERISDDEKHQRQMYLERELCIPLSMDIFMNDVETLKNKFEYHGKTRLHRATNYRMFLFIFFLNSFTSFKV